MVSGVFPWLLPWRFNALGGDRANADINSLLEGRFGRMTMKDAYLVIGVPASGKSFVCDQLKDSFHYVHHDGFIYLKDPGAYLTEVRKAFAVATKPLLIEAPFSMKIMDDLKNLGFKVTPVFIIEKPEVLRERYAKRGRHESHIIQGHLTRQVTFLHRALEQKAFFGDSTQVLEHLKGLIQK